MRSMRKIIALGLIVGVAAFAAACDDGSDNPGQKAESQTQQSNYDRLAALEPAHRMAVSPTRNTINFWIDTWGKDPEKLAYVYMLNSLGQTTGYYIFKGLPVSYCASITPNYTFVDVPGDGNDQKTGPLAAPSIDGVYYSGGGCDAFYGKDASSGSYVEFTVTAASGYRLFDRPLPLPDVKPLAFATVDNVKP